MDRTPGTALEESGRIQQLLDEARELCQGPAWERVGVEMQNVSRCAEIETRFPGLLPAIVSALKTQSGERSAARPRKKSKTKG